MIEFRQRQAR